MGLFQILYFFIAPIFIVSCKDQKKLKLREDGTFTMLQLTDLHYGESDDTDFSNNAIVSFLVDQERPDLAVVTGDVVSGYSWDGKTKGWFAKVYDKFAQILTKMKMNWAFTAGNHDTEADLDRN